MDKKSYIGLVLIFVIIVFFQWLNAPSEEQRQAMREQNARIRAMAQHKADSLASVKARLDSISLAQASAISDSDRINALTQKYGLLGKSVEGTTETTTLQNKNLKLTFSNKGGKILSAELVNYKAYGNKPLELFKGEQNQFGFSFIHASRSFFTNDLYFQLSSKNDSSIVYSLPIGNGSVDFCYTLPTDGYMVNYSIITKGVDGLISNNGAAAELEWAMQMPVLEKGRQYENKYSSTVCYRFSNSDVEELNMMGEQSEEINMQIDWVAFKDQFFSTIFCADKGFAGGKVYSNAHNSDVDTTVIKDVKATLGVKIDLDNISGSKTDFSMIFTPNDYDMLRSYEGKEFVEILPLGWGIFGWCNEWVIIPVFKFLQNLLGTQYGLIILLLTIIIKTLIFPFTFSSYKSMAKMRVLKPQIDEINKKYRDDQMMEKQQETMKLYKRAGVSPMGGCLPMLLQMPFLIAAFRFFPCAVDLRGHSFLWADDLSSYDSIWDMPFSIPFYGDHVSLFCILMCVAQIIYTKFNTQMQPNNAMPGMNAMMYMMPVMMLFFLNDYPAALNYYYCISFLITILQNIIIKKFFINEEAILAQLEANKKKPMKKSRWQAKYEEMLKAQQAAARKR